jgi:hypothetical protein
MIGQPISSAPISALAPAAAAAPVALPFAPRGFVPLKSALSGLTPSDSTDLVQQAVSLYVGGTGDLAVVMAGGQTVTFKAVPAGTFLNILVNRVLAAGTTATLVDAFW